MIKRLAFASILCFTAYAAADEPPDKPPRGTAKTGEACKQSQDCESDDNICSSGKCTKRKTPPPVT